MAVLIKGMEMPASEEKCKFFQPAPFRAPFCVINGVCHGINDCSLVPVPPHGRLIDGDALCKTLRSLAENEYMPEVFANWIENHIDTIIPASEEGEA